MSGEKKSPFKIEKINLEKFRESEFQKNREIAKL